MILETTMLYLYVETPLHAGTGSGLSSIDLPIQRERTTQYPMIQGSSIKGKLRSAANRAQTSPVAPWEEKEISAVFGPEASGAAHAGALIAGDARILLFPVRSLSGVFAYTTSCDVLNRFLRDMKRGERALSWNIDGLSAKIERQGALVPQRNVITADNMLVLEEFSFTAKEDRQVNEIANWLAENAFPVRDEYKYWRERVRNSLVILSDDDFRDFVVNATEIITRIRLNSDTKTVEKRGLWTEEHLPADTLLYVPIYATDARRMKENSNGGKPEPTMLAASVLEKARSLEQSLQGYIQLGGDETVGRGMVCMHWEQA